MIRDFIELIGALVLILTPTASVLYYIGTPIVIASTICSALAAVIAVAVAESL